MQRLKRFLAETEMNLLVNISDWVSMVMNWKSGSQTAESMARLSDFKTNEYKEETVNYHHLWRKTSLFDSGMSHS